MSSVPAGSPDDESPALDSDPHRARQQVYPSGGSGFHSPAEEDSRR